MGIVRQNAFRTTAGITAGFVGLGLVAAPMCTADTQLITDCPQITETGGVILGDTATQCATQDNYQYNATPNAADFPTSLYPWDDEFYGPALIMGGLGHGGAR